jgi:vancomycin resistance protein YoaR
MAGDLGLEWTNESDIDAALSLGKKGNIVRRYKAMQDLKYGNKIYKLELAFDKDVIRNVLEEQCAEYDVKALNATMTKVNGQFVIEDGRTGEAVNIDESLAAIYDYLTNSWDYYDASIDLVIDVTEPKGSREQLSKLTDVLGTYTTSYSTSSAARCKNVENGCKLINGTLLYPGDEFSTYDTIKPFTEANGYYPAGSYLNGKVVESLGGGICQVSTTLYNAVLLSELDVTERNNHSMIVTYVKPSMDAAIAESSGKDFKFVNNYDNPIYIEGVTAGKEITFTIYGVDTRDAGHKVTYISETLTTTQPDHEEITASSSMAIGEIDVQSAHVGYTAQLWKVVTENGVEVSREVINKSTYKVSPRSATVGISSSNPTYVARMQAAIATGSIDTCKSVAAAIKSEAAAAAQQQTDLDAYYSALEAQQAAAEAEIAAAEAAAAADAVTEGQ